MTVKSNDCNINQWEGKPKPIETCAHDFSRALSKSHWELLRIRIGSLRRLHLLLLVEADLQLSDTTGILQQQQQKKNDTSQLPIP